MRFRLVSPEPGKTYTGTGGPKCADENQVQSTLRSQHDSTRRPQCVGDVKRLTEGRSDCHSAARLGDAGTGNDPEPSDLDRRSHFSQDSLLRSECERSLIPQVGADAGGAGDEIPTPPRVAPP